MGVSDIMGEFIDRSHKTIRIWRNQFRVANCNYKLNPFQLLLAYLDRSHGWKPGSDESINLLVELAALIYTGTEGSVGDKNFLIMVEPGYKDMVYGEICVSTKNGGGKCVGIVGKQRYGYEVIANDSSDIRKAIEYSPEYGEKLDWNNDLQGLFVIIAEATNHYTDQWINDQLVHDLINSGLPIERLVKWSEDQNAQTNGWHGLGSTYHAFNSAVNRAYRSTQEAFANLV